MKPCIDLGIWATCVHYISRYKKRHPTMARVCGNLWDPKKIFFSLPSEAIFSLLSPLSCSDTINRRNGNETDQRKKSQEAILRCARDLLLFYSFVKLGKEWRSRFRTSTPNSLNHLAPWPFFPVSEAGNSLNAFESTRAHTRVKKHLGWHRYQ